MTRHLVGLSIGSGREAADAAVVRIDGSGLGLLPRVAATARVTLPADARADPRRAGECLALAARQAADRAGLPVRGALAAGLLAKDAAAEVVAEQTGLTVVTGFPDRDRAAGGGGQLATAAGDALLVRDPAEDRLLVHLGAVTSVLLVPAGGKLSAVAGFEAGPGNKLLDDVTSLGTRGRDPYDHGGTRAVQGRPLEPLLARWLGHPHLSRRPPKAVPAELFGPAFLADAFETARSLGGTLPDLLCTATQYVARCVGVGCERWLPGGPRRVLVSGGGTRNGYLWQRLAAEFPGGAVERLDAVGVPGSRAAAAAAVLAALTLDGVAGNLPLVTGAAGGRLVGRIVPGDARNWAACLGWMHDQAGGHLARAA